MNRLVTVVMVALLSMAAPLAAVELSEEQMAAKAQMEELSKKGFEETAKVVAESGGFFPYAMLLNSEDKIQVLGYQGTAEDKPPADEYFRKLYTDVVKVLETYPGYKTAILIRPHVAKDAGDNLVPGIWMLADHRKLTPVVMFLPFLQQDDGSYRLGEVGYLPAKEHLFPPLPSDQ